jgi:hypothetical protein
MTFDSRLIWTTHANQAGKNTAQNLGMLDPFLTGETVYRKPFAVL